MGIPHSHTHDHEGHGHSHGETAHSHAGHAHSHAGHSHAPQPTGENRRRLGSVLILTAGFMVVEALAGFWTNSLALISDAGHMLTDVGALGLALFALWFSRQVAPHRLTYGYLRFEILAALINGLALLGITGFIFWEAAQRLRQPPEVHSGEMLVVAILGLCVNLVSLYLLSSGGGHSLNERGAMLHVLGDLLGSVGAIIAAALIGAFNWYWADPVASAVIGLLILRSTWELLKEAVNILMEGTPVHLDVEELHRAMLAVPGVLEVRDLHVWSLASGFEALSAHVIVPEGEPTGVVRGALRQVLREQFGIGHTTLEVEHVGDAEELPTGFEGRCGAWEPGRR